LKCREPSVMLSCMAAGRLAAALVFACATALAAQTTSTSQIVVTVVDTTGAVVPGAHIGVVPLPASFPNGVGWLQFASTGSEQTSTESDRLGEATVSLAKGSYAVRIRARGFRQEFERVDIGDEPGQVLRVAVTAAPEFFGSGSPNVSPEPAIVQPESISLNTLIPLEPLQTITFCRRVRRHWF